VKKTLAGLILILLFASFASAHSLFLTVSDNEDGTILIAGMYSTGTVASATEVRLEDADGKLLFKGKTDEDGELEIVKPTIPYIVILDGGPGHVATEEGP